MVLALLRDELVANIRNIYYCIAQRSRVNIEETFLCKDKPAHLGKRENVRETRSSESDGRSDVTDSLDCHDMFRLP